VLAVASWDFWEWGKTKYNGIITKADSNRPGCPDRRPGQVALDVKNAYLA